MNLAIRLQVPIFVAEKVLDEAGLIPEEDLSEASLDEEMDTERLSVFENYLEKITPDEPDQPEDEEDPEKD